MAATGNLRGRRPAFLLTALAALALLAIGIFHGEIREVLSNGALLCLSCVGVG